MRDILADYERFLRSGKRFGRAVVTSVWGSAPRPEGSTMLAAIDGTIAGSVSGGCVESATALEIGEAITRGTPKLLTFGVTDEQAWEVGLACGGTIKVFVEPAVRSPVLEAARGPGGEVVATIIRGEGLGSSVQVLEGGRIEGTMPVKLPLDELRQAALMALCREASTSRELETEAGPVTVFFEVFPRQPRLVIFGGVQIAVALVPLAKALGYYTIVADGRQAFIGRDRFPEADELILAWPEEAFERIGLDSSCYVCVLSHDPKFDEPALQIALRSPAAYVGAIGSRKTQEARRERLRQAGLTEEQIQRLHGPIGLDLGGRQPGETALAILAEMTAVRYGGTAGREGRETEIERRRRAPEVQFPIAPQADRNPPAPTRG
jgi:xanthine dehydrogenase accessory factor